MERVRIKELQLKLRTTKGTRITNNAIAEEVLKDAMSGENKPLTDGRKRTLVSGWDNGKDLGALKPRHLMRLAVMFNTYDLRELIQSDDKVPSAKKK